MPDNDDRKTLFGDIAVELGLITAEQLRLGLEEQAKDKARFGFIRQMGTILTSRGWLTEGQVMDLLREQSKRRARRLRSEGGDPSGR